MTSPRDIYQSMQSILDQPGYSKLTAYRSDFDVYDKALLDLTFTSESEYLWMVRQNGTHLIALHIHPRIHDEARVVLQEFQEMDLFKVDQHGVKSLHRDDAEALLGQYRYQVQGHQVHKQHRLLARKEPVVMDTSSPEERHYSLNFAVDEDSFSRLTAGDIMALRQIGEREIMSHAQSLFVNIKDVTLNHQSAFHLFDQARSKPRALER